MENKLVIIGIDSLDPNILLKYKAELPNFSKLMDSSDTQISKPVFPVDTIPCWGSIYTGLNPAKHGLLYVYDIFDPNLSDLKKLDTNSIRGKTFWDFVGNEGYKTTVLFPTLMYPSWKVNGCMVSKSPFDERLDWLKTESEVKCSPEDVQTKYNIPKKLKNLWGGFPGENSLHEWAELGKDILKQEEKIALNIYQKSKWDLFFVYFSILDIIQHRLWRFYDKSDPTYPGKTNLEKQIFEYYVLFDSIIGRFIDLNPELSFLVLSDHGHKMRPIHTINLNEYLRRCGYLVPTGKNKSIMNIIREISLKTVTRLNIEHLVIKMVTKSPKITQLSKSIYSSSDCIDTNKSMAFLSNFAGIKSYSYGGIEINREIVSDSEYELVRSKIIDNIGKLNKNIGKPIINWVKKREDVYEGNYNKTIFPDIVFNLEDDYCVGWDLLSDLLGKSYDHKVASGGHGKESVFFAYNINREFETKKLSLMDVTPTILDLFHIDLDKYQFDGKSALKRLS